MGERSRRNGIYLRLGFRANVYKQEVFVAKLTIDEIRKIKEAQAEADRKRLASMTGEEISEEWEARRKIYQELFPNRPKPGTDKWKAWRGFNA